MAEADEALCSANLRYPDRNRSLKGSPGRGGLYRLQSLYKMDAWDIGVNQGHLAQRNRQSKPADGVALEMVEEAMVASR